MLSKSGAGKKIALAAAATLLSLSLLEPILRLALPHIRGSHQHPSTIVRDDFLTDDRIGQHDADLGWRLRPNHTGINRAFEFSHLIRTNAQGYRDDEKLTEGRGRANRILLLGDSFAMGDGIKRPFGFADVLEQSLADTEVINLGVSGYGTDQELLVYRMEGKDYGADIVLLALTIANDFGNNAANSQYGMSKPYFELNGDELVLRGTPVPMRERLSEPAEEGSDQTRASRHPVHDFLDARLALYALAFDRLSQVRWIRKNWERSGLLFPQVEVFYSGQVGILQRRPTAPQEHAWNLTLHLLGAWADECKRDGARPILVLIPSHLQVNEKFLNGFLHRHGLNPKDFQATYPNTRLREFCESKGIEIIDLLPGFKEASESEELYYQRNPHWNRKGHRVAGKLIAEYLRQNP